MGFFGIKTTAEKQATVILLEGYKELYEISENMHKGHAFDLLVRFFDATSRIQDNLEIINATLKGHSKVKSQLKIFNDEINKCGRNEFGWNRTKKNQKVTANDVYLGNIYGLFTKTVQDWWGTNYKDKYYKDSTGFNPIYDQAESFMQSYLNPKTNEHMSLLNLLRDMLKELKVDI